MTKTIHGKVEGRTIVLDEPLGLPLGQEVDVIVTPVTRERRGGEGILRSAGALADDPYWDDVMANSQRERKIERRWPMEDL